MVNMRSNRLVIGAIRRLPGIILAMLMAGCGTLATPVMHEATATPITVDKIVPETTPTVPPTETPLPPTDTPIPEPTAIPTAVPTATPEPTVVPVLSPIDRLVSVRDIENGAILFELFQDAANYSCSNCHLPNSEKTNLGPGLLNVKHRALTRVEGKSAAEYIYESIIDPQAYLVEEFDPELMPRNWAEIYSDLEIFDIVAYLMTLEGESDLIVPEEAAVESDSG